jgi:PadR family transcriptional regulator AphA
VSYVVLGLIARDGPSTAYEVKIAVGRGIAAFWPFPHSQLYSETEWLAQIGFLAEEQEESGRRRRIYRITPAGHAALRAWLADPVADDLQIRSLGLLKLFFGRFAAPQDIAALANGQRKMLDDLFKRHEGLLEALRPDHDRRWQMAVAELLFAQHRSMTQHWKRIEQQSREESARAPVQRGNKTRRRPARK